MLNQSWHNWKPVKTLKKNRNTISFIEKNKNYIAKKSLQNRDLEESKIKSDISQSMRYS